MNIKLFSINMKKKKYKNHQNLLKIVYGRNILENLKTVGFFFTMTHEEFFLNYKKTLKNHRLEIVYRSLNLTLLIYHSFIQCDIFSGDNLVDITQHLFECQKKNFFFSKNCELSDKFGIFLLQKSIIEKKRIEIKIFFYYFPIIFIKSLKFGDFFLYFECSFSDIFFTTKKNYQKKRTCELKKSLANMFNEKKVKKYKIQEGINFEKYLSMLFFLTIFPENFSNFTLKLTFFSFFIKNSLKFFFRNTFNRLKKPFNNKKLSYRFQTIIKKLNSYNFIIFFQSMGLMKIISQFFIMMMFFDKNFFSLIFLKNNLHPLKNFIIFQLKSFVF